MPGEIETSQGEIEMSIKTNIPVRGLGYLARLEQGLIGNRGSGARLGLRRSGQKGAGAR